MIECSTVSLISNIGFPVFVAVYFMTTMNRTLKQNTQALIKLEDCIKNDRRR